MNRGLTPGRSVSAVMPKEKPPITVVGDVGGRIAIIVVSVCPLLQRCLLCESREKRKTANKCAAWNVKSRSVCLCSPQRILDFSHKWN